MLVVVVVVVVTSVVLLQAVPLVTAAWKRRVMRTTIWGRKCGSF